MKLVRLTARTQGKQPWYCLNSVNKKNQYYLILTIFRPLVNSIKDDCFIYKVNFHGVNLPPDCPVMKKKILGWEPSVETLYMRNGMLKSDIAMVFKVEGGAHYRSDFKTTYK